VSAGGPDEACCAHGARVGAIGPGGILDVSGSVVRRGMRATEGVAVEEGGGFRADCAVHGVLVAPGNDMPG